MTTIDVGDSKLKQGNRYTHLVLGKLIILILSTSQLLSPDGSPCRISIIKQLMLRNRKSNHGKKPSNWVDIKWIAQEFGFQLWSQIVREVLILSMCDTHWWMMTNLQPILKLNGEHDCNKFQEVKLNTTLTTSDLFWNESNSSMLQLICLSENRVEWFPSSLKRIVHRYSPSS